MRAKGRDAYGNNHGENNGQAVLTKEEVLEIKKHLADGFLNLTEIGLLYGVTRKAIAFIRDGVTWRHLQEAAND